MKEIRKQLLALLNIDYILAGMALIALIAVTFIGVIMRYFVNEPLVWQEEVQLWCFVWITFFGASSAFRNGSHVAIDIVVDLLPAKVQKVISWLIYIIAMFILGYFLFYGNQLVQQLINIDRTTDILGIPYYIICSVMPMGCILMMISLTVHQTLHASPKNPAEDRENP